MMRRISDSLPAAIIGLGSGVVALGLRPFPASIALILPWPMSIIWVWMLFLSCMALIVGVWLRTPHHSEGRVIGLGIELGAGFIAGGMPLIYAIAIGFAVGWGVGFLSICFMLALASAFLGPWAVMLLTSMRAAKSVPRLPPGESRVT